MSFVNFKAAGWFDAKPRQNPLLKAPPVLPKRTPQPLGALSGVVNKVVDWIRQREIRLDWNMYRDFLASKIFGKRPMKDLNTMAQDALSKSNSGTVQQLGRHANPVEAIKAAISKMLFEDLSRYSRPRPAMAYSNIKVILANIQDAGVQMDLLSWIRRTINDNMQSTVPKAQSFITYLRAIEDHYKRQFSKDPAIKEQAIGLEQAKNYILGVLEGHPELKADTQSLKSVTETLFKDDAGAANGREGTTDSNL